MVADLKIGFGHGSNVDRLATLVQSLHAVSVEVILITGFVNYRSLGYKTWGIG